MLIDKAAAVSREQRGNSLPLRVLPLEEGEFLRPRGVRLCGFINSLFIDKAAAVSRGQRRRRLRPAGCDKAKRVNGITFGSKQLGALSKRS